MIEHYRTCNITTQRLTTTDSKHFYIAVTVVDDDTAPTTVTITRGCDRDPLNTFDGYRADDFMEFIGDNADTLTSNELLDFLKTIS